MAKQPVNLTSLDLSKFRIGETTPEVLGNWVAELDLLIGITANEQREGLRNLRGRLVSSSGIRPIDAEERVQFSQAYYRVISAVNNYINLPKYQSPL